MYTELREKQETRRIYVHTSNIHPFVRANQPANNLPTIHLRQLLMVLRIYEMKREYHDE